jgi:aminoglycoside/choline kinase family phosphotransferase
LTAILVEYPCSVRARLPRDLEVLEWCRDRGLKVPAVFARDLVAGSAILEDLGSHDGETAMAANPPDQRRALLEQMLCPLDVLAACPLGELPPWNPPLNRSRLRWELAGFELWFVRYLKARPPWRRLGRWLDELARTVAEHPRKVCHRDYHFNNLLVQPNGDIAVIDIQDILVGPDTYDVVSLIAERAATRLISHADRSRVLESWAERTHASSGWRDRASAVRLQRGLKVLGTFARFTVAGRTEYRNWLSDLARAIAAPARELGADSDLVALLLD